MKRSAVFPILLAFCLPTLALAAPAGDKTSATSVERILKRMDRDNDGKLGFEEYRNAMTRRFLAEDANGDGALESDEIPKEWLAVGATDLADGKISTEEFAARLQPTFDGFDLDRDGKLSDDELASFAQARAAKLEGTP
jgi:Ca2+-binding EF-hand superfamily protein